MPTIKKKQSHKHKKFNRYTANPATRRKRTGSLSIWWLVPAFAVLSFVIALLIGSFLGDQVTAAPDETPAPSETQPEQTLPPPENIVGGTTLDAAFVTLSGVTGNTAYEVSSQIPENTTSVSLELFDENGIPYFESEIALSLGKPCGDLTLKNTFKPLIENEIYSSVLFPSSALTSLNATDRYMQNAYEFSLMRELVEAGANEILIYCTPFGKSNSSILLEDSFAERFIEYVGDIKRKFPSIRIGFSVSAYDLPDPSVSEIICIISEYVDFIAADVTAAKTADELSIVIDPAAISILRYEMRILLGGTTKVELDSQIALLDKLGLKNRQHALSTEK
jgi:hypothetical protein